MGSVSGESEGGRRVYWDGRRVWWGDVWQWKAAGEKLFAAVVRLNCGPGEGEWVSPEM